MPLRPTEAAFFLAYTHILKKPTNRALQKKHPQPKWLRVFFGSFLDGILNVPISAL